jgi:hypothetical protein
MSRLARGLCQHSNSLVLCWACLPPLRPGGLLKHKWGGGGGLAQPLTSISPGPGRGGSKTKTKAGSLGLAYSE